MLHALYDDVLVVARAAVALTAPDEDGLVERLLAGGFSVADADRAVILVPSAFARLVLRRLGVRDLPKTYQVLDGAGTWREVGLGAEPWYCAALAVSAAVEVHGYAADGCVGPTPTLAEYEAMLRLSPEIGVTGKAMDQGIDIRDAKMSPLQVYRWKFDPRMSERANASA